METDKNRNETFNNVKSKDTIVTGMFPDRQSADKAYNRLLEKGYAKDDINLIMSDDTRRREFSESQKGRESGKHDGESGRHDEERGMSSKVMEDAGKGSAIGGTLGAVVGVIAALGTSLVIPGLGLLVAGPIAAGLAGAGAGGITGGIIGALVGWGIPEERAKFYESGIKSGHIVIGVHPRTADDVTFIEQIFREYNADEVRH